MTILKKLGFFFELPADERIGALKSIREHAADTDEDKILAYLQSGAVYAAMPNVEEDLLVEPAEILGPTHIRTDGVWAWPETLTHYIRRYHIELPEEFVTHVRRSRGLCDQNLDTTQLELEGHVCMD